MSLRVALVLVGDAAEALLLRAQFESLGARVDIYPIGNPADFAPAFEKSADVAVICAHGDEAGLIFEELAPEIDSMQLPGNRMSAGRLASLDISAPPVVISTACGTGRAPFASAFHDAGARLYLAPTDYPEGAAVPVWLNLAAYFVVADHLGWPAAAQRANEMFNPDNRFVVFER